MCKSMAEGGQRCAAHTKPRLEKASAALERRYGRDPEEYQEAVKVWENAAIEYASTKQGHDFLTSQANNAQMMGEFDTEATIRAILVRGENMREANKTTGNIIHERIITDSESDYGRKFRDVRKTIDFDPTVPGYEGDGAPVVLHVDTERNLTYSWYNISRRVQDFDSRDRGYLVSRLSVTHPGPDGNPIEVGYLNVSHTTKELMKEAFKTPFHWADENTGSNFGFKYDDNISDQKIWATAYTDLQETPPSMVGKRGWGVFSASQAPEDPEVLKKELDFAANKYRQQMRGMTRFLSIPFVDFSHVDDEYDVRNHPGHPGSLRGTGVGRQMYILAAEHLGKQGKVLRGSGCQTDLAQGLWGRLRNDKSLPVKKIRAKFYKPTSNPDQKYWCLDYRHLKTQTT